MAEPRRRYTEEFKREALRLSERSDKTLTHVARDMGIRIDTLQRWKRDASERVLTAFPGHGNPSDEEIAQLLKENTELKEERDILSLIVSTPLRQPFCVFEF